MYTNREAERFEINAPAKLMADGMDSCRDCLVNDISLMGLRVSLKHELPLDTRMKLSLVFKDDFVLNIEVWVAWHRPLDASSMYGLYFTKVAEKQKQEIFRYVQLLHSESHIQAWFGSPEVNQEGGEKMDDRRIFQRFMVKLPVRFLNLHEGTEGQAQAHDVSAKGLGLSTKEELKPRTRLEMWLQVPDSKDPIYTRGEVVWSRPASDNGYRVGIDLEKADLVGLSRILRS